MSGEKKSYPAEAVANWFIKKGLDEGKPVDHLRLQKLVYIAHGWCLAELEKPLINEPVQAWQYGPVIKSLYHALKFKGSSEITDPITLPEDDDFGIVRQVARIVPNDDEDIQKLLEKVWERYKTSSGADLIEATHKEGTPWDRVYKKGRHDIIIENNDIKPTTSRRLLSCALKKGERKLAENGSEDHTRRGLSQDPDFIRAQEQMTSLRRDQDRVLMFVNLVCVGIIAGTFAGLVGAFVSSIPLFAQLIFRDYGDVVGALILCVLFASVCVGR